MQPDRRTGERRRVAVTRRSFLAGAARASGATLAAAGVGPLLAACGPNAPAGLGNAPAPHGPHNPVLWPIYQGNDRIADGLPAERNATVRVFTWPGKVGGQCLAGFARKYRCRVAVTSFTTMTQALATLAKGPGRFDVFLGAPSAVVGQLVVGRLIQPLNRSYIPNFTGVWPRFASPYYDVHWRYTVPYTVYTTGIAWRKDLVHENPYTSAARWEFPWRARFRGQVGILDDYRESISLGLLSTGNTDLNTPDPRLINAARQALLTLADLVKTQIGNDTADALATGRAAVHHAWSGQAVMAAGRLPAGLPADVIGYWFPPDGAGPIGNDIGAVTRGARNPVLAHLLLDYLLDPVNAVANIRGTGYQQPLSALTPGRLVSEGALPRSLASAAVLPTFYDNGLQEFALPGPVDQIWRQAWSAVRGG